MARLRRLHITGLPRQLIGTGRTPNCLGLTPWTISPPKGGSERVRTLKRGGAQSAPQVRQETRDQESNGRLSDQDAAFAKATRLS